MQYSQTGMKSVKNIIWRNNSKALHSINILQLQKYFTNGTGTSVFSNLRIQWSSNEEIPCAFSSTDLLLLAITIT